MTQAIARAALAAALAAAAAAVWLAAVYAVRPGLVVTFDSEPPRLLSGMYPVERESGRTFVWTGDRVTLRLPGLDRRVPWTLVLSVRGARVAPAPNPDLTFLADGLLLETLPTTTDYGDLQVTVPARPDRRGLTLTIRVSTTFTPGPADPRPLGVMVDGFRLSPSGLVVAPLRTFAGTAIAAAAVVGAIAALGVTAGPAAGAAIVISAGVSSAVAHGFAPYTDFSSTAARTGVAIGLVLGVGALVARALKRVPLRRSAQFIAAFSAAALLLKLLVLLHPDMPIGDALFQAHRFQEVLAGHVYFTSTAPGNYQFPYAPGLYVFATPFASLVTRGLEDMALLRIITATTDTAAAVLLYLVVVRTQGDRRAAALTAVIYQMVPLAFGVLSVGNLTNAFAQSLSVGALALMADRSLRIERWWAVVLLASVLTAAFLSHTSTFAIVATACIAIACLFGGRGDKALRSPAAAVIVALAAALLISVALYYAHFVETYRTELGRIGVETAGAAPDAGGRGIGARVAAVPRYQYLYYGVPVLALLPWGVRALSRESDRLALSAAGWALACGAFLALGMVTPVDMRYYLAAIPAVALAAGLGASWAWSKGGWYRGVAITLLTWALVEGIRGWWRVLG